MKRWAIVLALCAAVLAGIFTYQNAAAAADDLTVSGTFTYRERIAVPPGATAIVQLQDISRADAAAITLAEQVLGLSGKSPPFDYALAVKADTLDARMRYAVRIEIRGPKKRLLWTTDTAHLVDPAGGDQTLEPITLVRVAGDTAGAGGDALRGIDWQVASVDGQEKPENARASIRFDQDGRVSGYAGCNGFNGGFEAAGGTVTLGALAMTRRACVPEIGAFEALFAEVFSGEMTAKVTGDTLTLVGGDGRKIIANPAG